MMMSQMGGNTGSEVEVSRVEESGFSVQKSKAEKKEISKII